MIQLWCACKADAAGNLLASENVLSVARTAQGVYVVTMANAMGELECSPVAVPWYVENAVPPQAFPLMRFLSGLDAAAPDTIIVRGFSPALLPVDGPFSMIVWRILNG